jgi:FkbM family methyltransferase
MNDLEAARRGMARIAAGLGRRIRAWPRTFAAPSYSQEGEDMVLRRIFEDKPTGFFIDVGAHHPKRFSNTYYFYRRGWRGINIDATPGTKRLFDKVRPRDINLETAVAERRRDLVFYEFTEHALNSAFPTSPVDRGLGATAFAREHLLRAEPLRDLLRRHLPPGTAVDFLSVDVEGMDLEVLRSNDWSAVRPALVLVECWGVQDERVVETPEYAFMVAQGYTFCAKTFSTVFFRERNGRRGMAEVPPGPCPAVDAP